jgi:hypothetical protein
MSIPQESEPISESNLPRPYEDVRQWLELVESMGELRRSASGSLDVCIPPENKGHSSRCLIDACMPYERRHQFPPITESSEELKNEIRTKWRETIYE